MLDGELEEVVVVEVVEEDDDSALILRMPLAAICRASVVLNCILLQSLGSF